MTTTPTTKQALPPVQVGGDAIRALNDYLRRWSGRTDMRIALGKPVGSPHGRTDYVTKTVTLNPDTTVLNPNRVLLTVTPFRLRQEAVLTGLMLHEVGHIRHTLWKPRLPGDVLQPHSDGTPVSEQAYALARLMEEPRVEARIAAEVGRIGAGGLDWTMRASAAHLLPTTRLDIDPAQQVMDLLSSWALRAGRQIGLNHATGVALRPWVADFTSALNMAINAYLTVMEAEGADTDPGHDTNLIIKLLHAMIRCSDDTGPTVVDMARDVLMLLFPETDSEGGGSSAMPSMGCGAGDPSEADEGEDGESDEAGEQGEGNTEPEDEGSGDDPGAGDSGEDEAESDEDEAGEGEAQTEDDEPGEGEQDQPGGGASDSTEDQTEAQTEEDQPGEDEQAALDALQQMLAGLEQASNTDAADEAGEESGKPAPADDETDDDDDSPASGAGKSSDSAMGGGWRQPTKEEREVAKGAERFLRDLINPTEKSKVTLSESPSASVDGAALAAWKAGGQHRDPMFFKRTRREVQPSSPVKIAILVDVSGSMEDLQAPSALLSWALASAALDLRNFAGRGQQVESTLIHWGSTARVIQKNGQIIPGIREVPCMEGTWAMNTALDLAEEEMPGFFDVSDRPEHRLLVQFTDWELSGGHYSVQPRISRALEAGVNMLTIAPSSFSPRYSALDQLIRECPIQRGVSSLLKYNRRANPAMVWDEAAKVLER